MNNLIPLQSPLPWHSTCEGHQRRTFRQLPEMRKYKNRDSCFFYCVRKQGDITPLPWCLWGGRVRTHWECKCLPKGWFPLCISAGVTRERTSPQVQRPPSPGHKHKSTSGNLSSPVIKKSSENIRKVADISLCTDVPQNATKDILFCFKNTYSSLVVSTTFIQREWH